MPERNRLMHDRALHAESVSHPSYLPRSLFGDTTQPTCFTRVDRLFPVLVAMLYFFWGWSNEVLQYIATRLKFKNFKGDVKIVDKTTSCSCMQTAGMPPIWQRVVIVVFHRLLYHCPCPLTLSTTCPRSQQTFAVYLSVECRRDSNKYPPIPPPSHCFHIPRPRGSSSVFSPLELFHG